MKALLALACCVVLSLTPLRSEPAPSPPARPLITPEWLAGHRNGSDYAKLLADLQLDASALQSTPGPKDWLQGWLHLPEGDLYLVASRAKPDDPYHLARDPLFLSQADLRAIGSRPVILEDTAEQFQAGDFYTDVLAKLGLKVADFHPEPSLPPHLV